MRNMAMFTGAPLSPSHNPGVPSPYTGRQKMYFSPESNSFTWHNAKYASNYYAAQVQGVIPGTGNFSDIRGAYIRSMDIVEQSTGTQLPNDWQCVYFQDPRIQGLHTGAKLWYAGNTWICTAPKAVASDTGNAVVRRCTAIWNYLDFYGNVKTEPFVLAKGPANATSNEYLDYNSIAHDYQRCAIQLNADTEQLRHNTRMILGHTAYQISGIVDFICDFSQLVQKDGETVPRQTSEPCHIMYFDLYRTEPLNSIDDIPIFSTHKVKLGDKERYVDCLRNPHDPIDACPFCAEGMPARAVRFIIMYQHDDQKVKIWERGRQFISKLQGLINRYNPLEDKVFEIERHGKAGDTNTKYEIYPLDAVDPINLDEVETPELEGSLILQKTFEEMEYYLDNGKFPSEESQQDAPVRRRGSEAPVRRATASTRRAPASDAGVTRRAAPEATQDDEPAPRSRASRRSGAEVF